MYNRVMVDQELKIDDEGWLPPKHRWPGAPSPNRTLTRLRPWYIVMHYTAGASAESSCRWLMDDRAKASAHFVVARDGRVWQLVSCQEVAWHAGRSSYDGLDGMNQFSVGIELANYGKLIRAADGRFWTTWGTLVPEWEVFSAHGGVANRWHRYTEDQLTAAHQLIGCLVRRYPTLADHVIGHSDVSPGRKVDPGDAFPMEEARLAARVARRGHE